jgi:hypothetical protein
LAARPPFRSSQLACAPRNRAKHGTLGPEINALAACESRLRAARTWPYNTGMIPTLFVSIVVPGGAAAAGFISDQLFR